MENIFEHFFKLHGQDNAGAVGTLNQVQPTLDSIEAVTGLVFDLDTKCFAESFRPKMKDFASRLLPGVELRQTSAEGNYHAILRFTKPVTVVKAKKIYKCVRKALGCDPNASFTMIARTVGSEKVKGEGAAAERFTVVGITVAHPVDPVQLLNRLSRTNDTGNLRWREAIFSAAVPLLAAADGSPLNRTGTGNGICPIHGSGENPHQCKYNASEALAICFGDCAAGNGGKPKVIPLEEILRRHVLSDEGFQAVFGSDRTAKQTVVLSARKQRDVQLLEVMTALAETKRFFLYRDSVYENTGGELRLVQTGPIFGHLAGFHINLVRNNSEGEPAYVDLPDGDGNFILSNLQLKSMLPEITFRTAIPVYDGDWNLVEPGFNLSSGIYYDAPALQPAQDLTYTLELLKVFRFKRLADRANYLAILLTPFLGPRFRGARPAAAAEGNRPGVGKSTAMTCVAMIQSRNGVIPMVTYTRDDAELEKQLATCAQDYNCIIIDNARVPAGSELASPALERTLTAPDFCFRKLGTNAHISGPNFLQFFITHNGGTMGRDLAERVVPIKFHLDGDPKKAAKPTIGDPQDYVRAHLQQIRQELLGMVERWNAAKRPLRKGLTCRFQEWAEVLGGILEINGFPEFLSTYTQDLSEVDVVAIALRELAEAEPDTFLAPKDWLTICQSNGLFDEQLRGKPLQGRFTSLGSILNRCVGNEVLVESAEGNKQTYVLQVRGTRKGREYGFLVSDPARVELKDAEPANLAKKGSAIGSDVLTPELLSNYLSIAEPAEPFSGAKEVLSQSSKVQALGAIAGIGSAGSAGPSSRVTNCCDFSSIEISPQVRTSSETKTERFGMSTVEEEPSDDGDPNDERPLTDPDALAQFCAMNEALEHETE